MTACSTWYNAVAVRSVKVVFHAVGVPISDSIVRQSGVPYVTDAPYQVWHLLRFLAIFVAVSRLCVYPLQATWGP